MKKKTKKPERFCIKQKTFVQQLGVSQVLFNNHRDKVCVRGEDFLRLPSCEGGVWMTEEGAQKMAHVFGRSCPLASTTATVTDVVVAAAATASLPAKAEIASVIAVSPTDAVEQVTVLPTQWLNDRLVKGVRTCGEPVRVRIRKGARKNVIAGMKLPCRMVETGLWECVRHPRYRGKM